MEFDAERAETNWEKDIIILGIDEAGRGPVIGPMVYACAYWKEEYDSFIKKKFQFNDSKALKPEEREKMYKEINDHPNIIKYEKIILSPEKISSDMLRREKISLNKISQDSAINLIQMARKKKINVKKIYVDTVGPANKYQEHLKKVIGDKTIEIKVEPKADAKFECVSAASIVAKVTRDHLINELGENYINCGSGYPSDPKTKEWLKNNYDSVFGYGRAVRLSWKTVINIIKANGNKCEWENYDSEEEEERRKNGKEGYKDSKQKTLNFWEKDENKNDEGNNSKENNKDEIKDNKDMKENTIRLINQNQKVRFYDKNDIFVSVDFQLFSTRFDCNLK